MNIDEIPFVTLPEKSYYAFKFSKGATGVKQGSDGYKETISVVDKDAWEFNKLEEYDFCYLGKKNSEGVLCGHNFAFEERLFTGPDRKKVFKWVIVDGQKFFAYEEIPKELINSWYRYQYRLVPVEKVLGETGNEAT